MGPDRTQLDHPPLTQLDHPPLTLRGAVVIRGQDRARLRESAASAAGRWRERTLPGT